RALKALVIERQRARDRDDIVGRLLIELHAVPELDADIVDRDGQQVRARAIYELGKDLDASHAAGELAQTSCEITRAGADHQGDFIGVGGKRLRSEERRVGK